MDRAADARSVAIRVNAQLLVVRSRLKVWRGGSVSRQGVRKCARAHFLSEAVAERRCGALGGELPTRLAGPRDRAQRAPSEAVNGRICTLLSRRPDASGTREGYSGRPVVCGPSRHGKRNTMFPTTRRPASSLRTGSVG